jgi:hypothetical protein
LLFDLDEAGDRAASEMHGKFPDRCRRLYLPTGRQRSERPTPRRWVRSRLAGIGVGPVWVAVAEAYNRRPGSLNLMPSMTRSRLISTNRKVLSIMRFEKIDGPIKAEINSGEKPLNLSIVVAVRDRIGNRPIPPESGRQTISGGSMDLARMPDGPHTVRGYPVSFR